MLLLELATARHLHCTLDTLATDWWTDARELVTFVEVDACTNRPFETAATAIDPTDWPAANPFFGSVTIVGQPTQLVDRWCGRRQGGRSARR